MHAWIKKTEKACFWIVLSRKSSYTFYNVDVFLFKVTWLSGCCLWALRTFMRKALRHETLIAFVSRRDIRPRRLHLKIFVFQRTAMTTILFPHLHALSPLIHIPVSSCSDFQLRYPKECTCPSSVSLGSVGHSVVKGQRRAPIGCCLGRGWLPPYPHVPPIDETHKRSMNRTEPDSDSPRTLGKCTTQLSRNMRPPPFVKTRVWKWRVWGSVDRKDFDWLDIGFFV